MTSFTSICLLYYKWVEGERQLSVDMKYDEPEDKYKWLHKSILDRMLTLPSCRLGFLINTGLLGQMYPAEG